MNVCADRVRRRGVSVYGARGLNGSATVRVEKAKERPGSTYGCPGPLCARTRGLAASRGCRRLHVAPAAKIAGRIGLSSKWSIPLLLLSTSVFLLLSREHAVGPGNADPESERKRELRLAVLRRHAIRLSVREPSRTRGERLLDAVGAAQIEQQPVARTSRVLHPVQ